MVISTGFSPIALAAKDFICFVNPTTISIPKIVQLAEPQLYVSRMYKGTEVIPCKPIIVVNTTNIDIIDRVPTIQRVVLEYKQQPPPPPPQITGKELAEYLQHVYENPYCLDLDRWDPIHYVLRP